MARFKQTRPNGHVKRSNFNARPFSMHSHPWHKACTSLNRWKTGEIYIIDSDSRKEAMNPPFDWKVILRKRMKVLKGLNELRSSFVTSLSQPGLNAIVVGCLTEMFIATKEAMLNSLSLATERTMSTRSMTTSEEE
jgi:hypothetical protein